MERRSSPKFFTWFANPHVALFVGRNVFGLQFLDVGESQFREATEYENIPHVSQLQIRLRLDDQHLDLFFSSDALSAVVQPLSVYSS